MSLRKETEKYQKKNFKKFGFNMNLTVSLVSAVIVLGFIFFTITQPSYSSKIFSSANLWINTNFNWLYVLTINLSFIFLIYLAFSKFGKIRLGGFNSKPEFSNFAWYAMLFSAGIGIGIFFYGVAEPIKHLNIPEGLQSGSIYDNFKMMYLHWGIHAWSVYGLVAVGLGYFSYDKGLPFSLRSLFYPLIKDKIFTIWGDIIDIIAVISVLFGLATSLGLGASQINSGLHYVFNIPYNNGIQVALIVLITLFATMSVVSGINKGIKYLSQLNTYISAILLFFILILGPTAFIFSTYVSSFGLYLKDFIGIGTFISQNQAGIDWQQNWTIFFWAWWISWTPFVGTFIAQISKGRTIKEIAIGTVVVPTIIITFVMTILGATGIYENTLFNGVIEQAIDANIATSMFEMFKYLVSSKILINILSVIAIIAIVFFFITSSDSGSLVVDNLTSGGLKESPKVQRVFWAAMEGAIALTVLILGGSNALETLQSAVIITAFPFSILLIIVMISLIQELRVRYKKYRFNSYLKLRQTLDNIPDDAKFKK